MSDFPDPPFELDIEPGESLNSAWKRLAAHKRQRSPSPSDAAPSKFSRLDDDSVALPRSSSPPRYITYPGSRYRPRVRSSHPVQQIPITARDPLLEDTESAGPPRKRIKLFRPRLAPGGPYRPVDPSPQQALLFRPPSVSSSNVPAPRVHFRGRPFRTAPPRYRASLSSQQMSASRYFTKLPSFLSSGSHPSNSSATHPGTVYRPLWDVAPSKVEAYYRFKVPRLREKFLVPFTGYDDMLQGPLSARVVYLAHFLLHLFADSLDSRAFTRLPDIASIFRRIDALPFWYERFIALQDAIDDHSRLRSSRQLSFPKFMPGSAVYNMLLPFPLTRVLSQS